MGSMPSRANCAPSPMPVRCKISGEPTAPAARMTCLALTCALRPRVSRQITPVILPSSTVRRSISAPVTTFRFWRREAVLRKATLALWRHPRETLWW